MRVFGEGERESNTKANRVKTQKEIWVKATWGVLCPIFVTSVVIK